jgi:F420-non-reducing hydrogenase small subunit
MSKPKFAMYWSGSCGGCEIAVLNIHEKILDVDANFEIAFWPVAMDAKVKDVEVLADGEILLTLWNGSIRNVENEHMARLLRRKSKLLVSFGSCATEGCVPGLANLAPLHEIIDTAYTTLTTDNPNNIRPQPVTKVPEGEISIPMLTERVHTLAQVVEVDYFMPGCPPESHQIAAVIDLVIQVVQGKAELPRKGAVIGAGKSTVCEECPRTRNIKSIKAFRRIQDVAPLDPELCILEQGIPCNGPATRSGCDARCPRVGAQCIGCYGPAEGVTDYGARLLSAFASVIDADEPEEIERILDGIPDPAGQFYRFSLAGSLFQAGAAAFKN